MTADLHMQYPTSQMTEYDYETVLCHLSEQIAARILSEQIGGRIAAPDRSEAEKTACDALANEFDNSEGVTISDWMRAAAKKCHVDPADCVGI